MFVGRASELLELGEQLRNRTPSLTVVRGGPGVGVTRFLKEALTGLPHLFFPVPHLPDEAIRALLRDHLLRGPGGGPPPGEHSGDLPDWPGLLALATEWAPPPAPDAGPPFTLVLDDAQRLLGRGAVPGLLRQAMDDLLPRSIPFHLVLAGTAPPAMATLSGDGEAPGGPELDIQLRPLTVAEAARFLPRWPAADRFAAWAVLGGHPGRLSLVPRRGTLAMVIQRMILDPEGPLHHEGFRILEKAFQAPARYGAVLAAVSAGARGWGDMGKALPGEMGGARLGPYVRGLEEQGLLRGESSLDARPGSRARRYAVPDPFLRFWFGTVLPRMGRLATLGPSPVWEHEVRPALEAHVAGVLPEAARLWLEHDAGPHLGAVAREAGALWGAEHDLQVAGILRNGGVVYGRCIWREEPLGEAELEELESQVRRVRYGIGREGRLRLLFGRGAATPGLRSRAARDSMVRVVGVRELLGEG
jgi:uncharacterized protein